MMDIASDTGTTENLGYKNELPYQPSSASKLSIPTGDFCPVLCDVRRRRMDP